MMVSHGKNCMSTPVSQLSRMFDRASDPPSRDCPGILNQVDDSQRHQSSSTWGDRPNAGAPTTLGRTSDMCEIRHLREALCASCGIGIQGLAVKGQGGGPDSGSVSCTDIVVGCVSLCRWFHLKQLFTVWTSMTSVRGKLVRQQAFGPSWDHVWTIHCNVWDAHMGSVIPMTTADVPFSCNWFRILKLVALTLPVSAPDMRNS